MTDNFEGPFHCHDMPKGNCKVKKTATKKGKKQYAKSELETRIKEELIKMLESEKKQLLRTHSELTVKSRKDKSLKPLINEVNKNIRFNIEEISRIKGAQDDVPVNNRKDVINDLLDVKVSLERGLKEYPGNDILREFIANVNKDIESLTGDDLAIKEKTAQLKQAILEQTHKHVIVMDKTIGRFVDPVKEAQISEVNGKKFAKIWLLNAQDINGNGWGVSNSTLDTNIQKFIGRPYVITAQSFIEEPSIYGDEMVHPSIPVPSIQANLDHQEKFRVGTIVDVIKENTEYFAQIEILPKFAHKSLPPFCSPAVFQMDITEPSTNFSQWEALHLAGLTEKPAYGARIALLKGTCVGTKNACKVQFSNDNVPVQTAQLKGEILCDKGKIKLLEAKLKLKLMLLQ